MRLVLLSDTHGFDDFPVPEGDVLVHAGDSTRRGRAAEITRFAASLARLPHPHKVVIAGNHDWLFQKDPNLARALLAAVPGLAYLEDAGCEIDGVRFWGSPWQPWFHDWAFNLPRGAALREKWALVPAGTHVLVTHGPPYGILDKVFSDQESVGCEELRARCAEVRPLVHLFGHIHEAAGTHREGGTLFVNASICDLGYRPTQPARVVDLDVERGLAELR